MTYDLIPPGARVARKKAGGFIVHRGVALPGNRVLHNTPERGEHVSSLAQFGQGLPVFYCPQAPLNAAQTVARAERIAQQPQSYRRIEWNCEHTEAAALGIRPKSPQAEFWLGLIAVGAVLFVVTRT